MHAGEMNLKWIFVALAKSNRAFLDQEDERRPWIVAYFPLIFSLFFFLHQCITISAMIVQISHI